MVYAPSTFAPRELAFTRTSQTSKPTRRGPLRWLVDAMMASRRRQAERDIARYVAGSGGKFTDEVEREIERRFLSTPSRW
jgi:hypothetical protein